MRAEVVFWVFLALLCTGSWYVTFETEWGRDLYCWGKVDALDPWC